jgi:Holliday junction resolvasome RuvABC ATP-dependent DNA helicase subunit
MPGIEKKLSRYAQLYSRVGFVHNFKPISKEEIKDIVKKKAKEFNLKCSFDDVFAEEALVEIIKITRGNFRLIQRLVMQIERIMRLNKINDLRKDVVETAKKSLITGTI